MKAVFVFQLVDWFLEEVAVLNQTFETETPQWFIEG